MWNASPPEPCWTARPTCAFVLRFAASAWRSRSANDVGTLASRVFVMSATFSSATGMP